MSKYLHIDVNNKIAVYSKRDGEIVCGNSDYVLKFTFDNEWDGEEEKTARLIWNGMHKDIPFTGDECPVPILRNTEKLYVGVFAGDLSTTTKAVILCHLSVLCEDAPLHPEEGEIYRDEAVHARDEAVAAASEARAAHQSAADLRDEVEEMRDEIVEAGGGGLTEDEVKKIVATETEGKVDKIIDENARIGTITVVAKDGTQKAYQVDNQSLKETIVLRDASGNFYVKEPKLDNHVTPKWYVDDADTANANKIADNTKRIENLESTSLTFIEDGESAYEKDVPVGVGKNAVLSSISGNTVKNYLDPSLFSSFETVNEDGSVRIIVDLGSGGSDFRTATVTLPAGTYYISGYDNVVQAPDSGGVQGYSFNNAYTSDNTITLGETTDVEVFISFDGVGVIETDVYVMVSTDPDAGFEPYFEGEKYGKVTAIESYGSNRFNYKQIFHDKNGTIEQIPTGLRVVGYNVITTLTPEQFLEMTGLKEGDTFTYSAIQKVISGGTWGGGGDNGSFVFYGKDSNPHLIFGGGAKEGYISVTRTIPTPFNSTTHGTVHIFGENGKEIDFTEIAITKGEVAAPYESYSAKPINTFTIPSEIQAINGYGKDGFVLNLERKTVNYESTTTDVSQYLTDYPSFKTILVQGGGKVRFVSTDKLPVPSNISYVKAKE